VRRRIRARVSLAWWAALGAVGLPRSRWDLLDRGVRRAVKAAIWVAISLILVFRPEGLLGERTPEGA
jgi:hypothetical protein